jgi:hypothetical protein
MRVKDTTEMLEHSRPERVQKSTEAKSSNYHEQRELDDHRAQ